MLHNKIASRIDIFKNQNDIMTEIKNQMTLLDLANWTQRDNPSTTWIFGYGFAYLGSSWTQPHNPNC